MSLELKYTLKDFDKGKIISKYGMEKGGNTQLFLADTCFRRMEKYVPMDTGALATTVTVKPGSVTYEQPYAKYMYYGKSKSGNSLHYSHDKNPLAGDHWDRRMSSVEGKIIAKEVEDYAKKMKGNK